MYREVLGFFSFDDDEIMKVLYKISKCDGVKIHSIGVLKAQKIQDVLENFGLNRLVDIEFKSIEHLIETVGDEYFTYELDTDHFNCKKLKHDLLYSDKYERIPIQNNMYDTLIEYKKVSDKYLADMMLYMNVEDTDLIHLARRGENTYILESYDDYYIEVLDYDDNYLYLNIYKRDNICGLNIKQELPKGSCLHEEIINTKYMEYKKFYNEFIEKISNIYIPKTFDCTEYLVTLLED